MSGPNGGRGRFRLPWRSRAQIAREVDEELSFHLDMRTDELVRTGVDPQTARSQARREFGDLEAARAALGSADEGNERRRSRSDYLHGLGMDFRHAGRSLRRERGSTLAAVLALALGIGAVTTVFSLVNWVLVRPVPGVSAVSELVRVQMRDESGDETGVSYPNYLDLEEAATGLRSLAGYDDIGLQIAGNEGPPTRALGAVVAGDYFGILGARPFAGRFFSPAEHSSLEPVFQVVVSHHLWRTFLAADPAVIGRRVRLNGIEFTVAGVAPEGFRGTERLGRLDAWIPLSAYSALTREPERSLKNRKQGLLREFVGRLAPGATPSLVEQRLRTAMARLVETYPEDNEKFSVYGPVVFEGIGLSPDAQQQVRSTLRLMLAIVGVLLLIAWANVANLLILRGLRRRGETAVRQALGASRSRLFQGQLAAGLLLTATGGAAGVLVAVAATNLLRGKLLAWLPEIERVELDWRVTAFVLLLSLTTALVVSIIPIWGAHSDLAGHAIHEATRGSTRRAGWMRGGLVAAQVALATILVTCGLLLARTLTSLNRVDIGFDAERVLVFDIDVSFLGYDPAENARFRSQLRERLEGLPGVEFASLASGYPFRGASMQRGLRPPDAPDAKPVYAWEFSVTPDYFSTLSIPLLAGRGFADESAASEVIVGRSLARNLFGAADPLGKQVSAPHSDGSRTTYTIVGVVDDIRVHDVRSSRPDAVMYRSMSALEPEWSGTAVLMRYAPTLSRSGAMSTVQHIVAEIEPSLAIWHAAPLSEMLADAIREERLLARMALLLAGLAAVLAAVGLYAVVAYSVAQRTREIGIRMALGARVAAILRVVGKDAALLVGAGVVAGLSGAAVVSKVLESRLFGVERLDPLIYLAAGTIFATAAAIALWGPLRIAAKVSPAEALRHE